MRPGTDRPGPVTQTPPVVRHGPLGRFFGRLGPGLITGAADDDPSGIATYSQAGAQFRFGLLWTMLLTTPLMIGIQMLSARIGWATRRGLAANIDRLCPKWVTLSLVAALVAANTINIAADLAAMGQALQLLAGGRFHVYTVLFGLACIATQVLFSYERTVRVLKWLTLALFAYVAVILALSVPWREALVAALLPWRAFPGQADRAAYATMIVAVLGTTISPYLFFWQAAQEVEDRRRRHETRIGAGLDDGPRREGIGHLRRIRLDTSVGMAFSNGIAICIMVATAITLNAHGIRDIQTSAQAAAALRPIAGDFAFAVFSLGIIGTGLLAVPVLAGSAAYAVSEVFGWPASLDRGFNDARGFYLMIIAGIVVGAALDFLRIDPIRALVWSAVLNGVTAVPIMAAMMWIGQSRALLGRYVITRLHRVLGWSATVLMALAVAVMLATAV